MRVKVLLASLGLGLILALVGCSGNGMQTFSTKATVTNLEGAPVSGTATLLQDSTVVKTKNFTDGNLQLFDIPNGTYTMVITGTGLVPTYVGLISNKQNPQLTIAVPTVAELNAKGIATPPTGSSTLYATAVDTSGNQLAMTRAYLSQFSVKVDNLAAVSSTLDNPSYAVKSGITPGDYPVTVTNTANNGTMTFPEVHFASGQFTAILAIVPSGGILSQFNANGIVYDVAVSPVAPVPDLTVAVRELTNVDTTTNGSGNYSFTDLPANVLTLKLTSNTQTSASIFTTYAGPFTGNSNETVALPPVSTVRQNEAGNIGVVVPDDGTATLVVYPNTTTGTVANSSVTVQGRTITSTTAPAIIDGLTATAAGSDIQVQAANQDVVLKSVPLVANTVTVVTAFIPST